MPARPQAAQPGERPHPLGPPPAQEYRLTPFDARLDPASAAPIALGLSGGGDSLALLTLALDWARTCGRRVLALTVDHGLQPQSAAWTERAGAQARRLGADWRGLAWTGPKPATGLAAAARRARHALLAEAAREAGAAVLLLGHTADDVTEGERMRAAGASLGRLRDWAVSPAWPQGRRVFLFRPLLEVGRAELRARLSALGLDWIEDPANADPRSLRARVRAELAAEAARRPGNREAIVRDRRDDAAAPRRSRLCALRAPAGMTEGFGAAGILALPRQALVGAGARAELAVAVTCASGRERPPRGPALDRLAARLARGECFVATLAGARVEADAAVVRIFREAGELARGGLAPLRLEPGQAAVWDGRFEITADEAATVRAARGLLARLEPADRAALEALPTAARGGAPVLIRDGDPRPILAARLARVCDLVQLRRLATCGLIAHEREITGLRVALAV